jgi:hypothetical protein
VSGDWIALIARDLIRQHTYERTVSPAIADLQFEAPAQSRTQRLIGYISIYRAVAGAVVIDIGEDLTRAFNREARASAWRAAAILWVLLIGLNVVLNWRPLLGMDELGFDGLAVILLFSLPSLAVAALPAVLVPFAVVMTRRHGAARPVLAAAVLVSLVVIVASVTLAVPAGRRADQYQQAAFWRARMDTADPPRSLEAIRHELTVELTRQDQRRARADRNRFLYNSIAAKAMGTFAFAFIGIGLARKRGWRMLLWGAGAYVVWIAILAGVIEWAWFPRTRSIGRIQWAQTFALYVVGSLALIAARRDQGGPEGPPLRNPST